MNRHLAEYLDEHDTYAEALQRAIDDGWTLNTYNDPTEADREDCSVEHAVTVATEDPSLVYLSRPKKPSKAVYKRMFAGEATAAEKKAVAAYNKWRRAGGQRARHAAYLYRKVDVLVPGALFVVWFKPMTRRLESWLIIRVGRKKWVATADGKDLVISAQGHRQGRTYGISKGDFFKSAEAAVEGVTNETTQQWARREREDG